MPQNPKKNPYNYVRLKEAFDELNQPKLPVKVIAAEIHRSEIFVWKVLQGEKWGGLGTMYALADVLGVPRRELILERNGAEGKNGK